MRLFVAVNLPSHEKDRLAAMLENLRTLTVPVRWVEPDSLHVTLKFLGEVAEARVEEIEDGVANAAQAVRPFELQIGGFGVFPSPNRARVFWIGLEASPGLKKLQQRVEEEISPLGFPTEKREFQPHLTLGRAKGESKVGREDVERVGALVGYNATVEITSADLMRSHLSPRGAHYERIYSAKLNGLS